MKRKRISLSAVSAEDCPEAVATSKGDMGHVREQMRYFGLEKASSVTAMGLNAKRYVARIRIFSEASGRSF